MSYQYEQDFGRRFEKTTLLLGGILKQPDVANPGSLIVLPGASLTTCTLTIRDVRTGAILTGYSAMDIKASVNGSGVLAKSVPLAGLVIVTTQASVEPKELVVRWTYNSGADGGAFRYLVTVVNDPTIS